MIDLNNLKLYKGTPITIITALLLLGRNASQKELMQICDYGSDKTVRDALDVLMQDHIVIKSGRGSYMLAMHQLPLSWSETIEKLPSEHLEYAESATETAESAGLKMQVEDLAARVSELEMIIGNRRKYGVTAESTGLTVKSAGLLLEAETAESAVEVVESAVKHAESTDSEMDEVKGLINNAPVNMVGWLDIDNNQPKEMSDEVKLTTETAESAVEAAEIPGAAKTAWKCAANQLQDSSWLRGAVLRKYESGRFTVELTCPQYVTLATTYLKDQLTDILETAMGSNVVLEFTAQKQIYSYPKFTEKEPREVPRLMLPEKDSYPGESRNIEICNEYLENPTGIEYSVEQLKEMIAKKPDPEVLKFVLPTMSSAESASKWCEWNLNTAKLKLLRYYKIAGKVVPEIANNANVTLKEIDVICKEVCPNTKLAVKRIQMLMEVEKPEM